MNNTTLLFLAKRQNGIISEICLALKKRGFGVGKWNGVGGKPDIVDKTIEDTAIREANEEIKISVEKMKKVAEVKFEFIDKKEWNQLMHVYICEEWSGVPEETEEMLPKWFGVDELPLKDMWIDDSYWLPRVLNDEFVFAEFKFDKDTQIQEYKIKTKFK